VIHAGVGEKDAYEQLRHHMLAALPASAPFGLAVLLREGVAAWIERCAGAASQTFTSPSPPRSSILTPPLQAGIVQILAGIALNRTQEMH
jgi:hypothetical protein